MGTKPKTYNQELLSTIIEIRTALLQAASGLSPAAQDTVFLGNLVGGKKTLQCVEFACSDANRERN